MSSSLHRGEGGSWGAFKENSFKVLGIQKSFGDAGSPNADVPLTLDKAASQTSTSRWAQAFPAGHQTDKATGQTAKISSRVLCCAKSLSWTSSAPLGQDSLNAMQRTRNCLREN